jgi:hypothetical protein
LYPFHIYCVTQWRQQQQWLWQQHLISASPSFIHYVSHKSDDEESEVLRHTWQWLIIVRRVTATTSTRIHIVSRGGDIDNASAAATNPKDDNRRRCPVFEYTTIASHESGHKVHNNNMPATRMSNDHVRWVKHRHNNQLQTST